MMFFDEGTQMKNEIDLGWFNLDKYDDQIKFGSKDWFNQLHKRSCIKLFGKKHPELAKKLINSIKEDPLLNDKESSSFKSSVKDAQFIDLLKASFENDQIRDFYTLSAEEVRVVENDFLVPKNENPKILSNPILAIDLGVSDEQLKLDFKHWLQEQRINSGYKPRYKMFTTNDYKKWISNMVLPYLDVTLILDFDGKDLPYHFIGNLLFPDEIEIDVTDKVRRTVKPLANSLLEIESLSVLRAQR
jgi:hypothetical protein